MWRVAMIAAFGTTLYAQHNSPLVADMLAHPIQDTATAVKADDVKYFKDKADTVAAFGAFVLSAADAALFADVAQEVVDIQADSADQPAPQDQAAGTAVAAATTTIVQPQQARPRITPVMIRDNLQDKARIIAAAEAEGRKTGLPPAYMAAMAVIESSITPSARRCQRRGCGGAVGLYQFVGGTGRDYGLVTDTADHRANAAASIQAAAQLARDNLAAITRAGMPTTGAHLYMSHQQGWQGAVATYRLAHGQTSGLRDERGLMHNIGNNLPGNIRRLFFNGIPNGRHKIWVLKPGVTSAQAATAFYAHWNANYARFEAAVTRTFAGQLRAVWA